MLIAGYGISVDLPGGWEARIFKLEQGEPTLHAANFALPARDGEFGSGALAGMPDDGAFVCLTEYGSAVAGTALFASVPTLAPMAVGELSPRALQRIRPGQRGAQRFATLGGRPFCLYVVVGARPTRPVLVAGVNQVLSSLRIGGVAVGPPAPATETPDRGLRRNL